MSELNGWQNNIVGSGVKRASEFKRNPLNFRVHPQAQKDALRGSLDTVGWIVPVIVNQRTGLLLDGHERVDEALVGGDAEVPYIMVDVPANLEAFVLATLDPIAAMAQINAAQMTETLRQVETDNVAVSRMVSEMAEGAGAFNLAEAKEAPDEFPEYGDDIDTMYCCPKCHYEWSGKPK